MLTISEVPAAGMVDAGETLQLEEVFLLATELAVATLLRACATRGLRLGLDIRQRGQLYYIQTKVHTDYRRCRNSKDSKYTNDGSVVDPPICPEPSTL